MTKKGLSQYYWLEREIEDMEKRLRAMRERAGAPLSKRPAGMPGGGGARDGLGDAVAEMADLEAVIAAKRAECIRQRRRIERFIYSMDDPVTRMVFTHRCIDGCSWREVAARMGHRMSKENTRQIFRRNVGASGEGETSGEGEKSMENG